MEDLPWGLLDAQTGNDGAEPTIGFLDGRLFTLAGDLTLASDDGQKWDVVHDIRLGAPDFVGLRSTRDPTLWIDPEAGRVHVLHMTPSVQVLPAHGATPRTTCALLSWSDDGGTTWTNRDGACTLPWMDHPKLVGGPSGPDDPRPEAIRPDRVLYLCHARPPQAGMDMGTTLHCSASDDAGLTWTREARLGPEGACGLVNGQPAVAPDGTVVVPITLGCDQPVLAVSRDSGTSWQRIEVPTEAGATSIDPEVAFAPDGSLLLLWRDGNHRLVLARLPDLAGTWQGPWDVSPTGGSHAFQALAVHPDGRVLVATLAAPTHTGDPSVAPGGTVWNLHVGLAAGVGDDGPDDLQFQRVGDDPVQVGCIWLQGGGSPCRNLLDFIDATATADGFAVAYTDGCVACPADESNGGQSTDRSIAVVSVFPVEEHRT